VQQRDRTFISQVCRSELRQRGGFQAGSAGEIRARADLLYVNRTGWGKGRERSRRDTKIAVNQLLPQRSDLDGRWERL